MRLRSRDFPALLERDNTLIVDTDTNKIGRQAERSRSSPSTPPEPFGSAHCPSPSG